ncbi:MAG TPA: S8 family peptidase [Bacillales bacterium]|nr:S8 family peptidase [Bacillales bacterium]
MLGFSMIQLVWQNSHKFDRNLREKIIHLYHPYRHIPCFLHRPLEHFTKKTKKFSVIIEFDQEAESFTSCLKNTHQYLIRESGSKIEHEFPSISCCSATLTASTIEKLINRHPNIKKIHDDRQVKAYLNVASPSIHAPQLNKAGIDGKNINIAIVDTGVYPHPDLTRSTNRIVAFKDFVNHKKKPYDDNGHGTHCAGDAAGNGFASDGKYCGPAPGAGIVGVKVLNQMGSGSLSTIVAGIQWCIDHQSKYHIDVISMSLGAEADPSNCDDPLVQIVEKAWEKGFVVCVAAGNSGPDKKTVGTPGISPKVITVGAIDDKNTADRSDDEIASFSSRGPACGDVPKPDLLAPGVNIVSLRAPGSFLDKTQKSSRVGQNYLSLSGTSMATPICAGVTALVLQAHPDYSPDQVKQHLMKGADDKGLPRYAEGAGYINAKKSVKKI